MFDYTKLLLCVTILFLQSNIIFAGPFGTEMGDKPSKYKNIEKLGSNTYSTKKLPKSHSGFDRYILSFGDDGLNSVIAVKFVNKDPTGQKSLPFYDMLKQELSEKYGNPDFVNEELAEGSVWEKDVFFMRGILEGERSHSCFWTKKSDNNKLIDNINSILLILNSKDGISSTISITYSYKNISNNEYQDKDSL